MALAIRSLAALGGLALSLTATGLPAQANTGVTVTSYGHSALLIQGGGASVLINPFRAVGCAAGLAEPRVSANVILASSRLLDEGAAVARGTMLSAPGSYRVAGLRIEGIAVAHDRFGGRRFGKATLWRWRQGGLEFVHLGGTAAPLSAEDQVLLSKPDVLIIGVGGGAKVYDGPEAAAVVRQLAPRRVIPVQYLSGPVPKACDLTSVEPFLKAMAGAPVKRVGRTLSLPGKLGNGLQVDVLR
jgi:L-ascorbate metabolism protein UlaG (beta-lactamase superfamily)